MNRMMEVAAWETSPMITRGFMHTLPVLHAHGGLDSGLRVHIMCQRTAFRLLGFPLQTCRAHSSLQFLGGPTVSFYYKIQQAATERHLGSQTPPGVP